MTVLAQIKHFRVLRFSSVAIACSILFASFLAQFLQPSSKLISKTESVDLFSIIPKELYSWHYENNVTSMLVNPETRQSPSKIYSQVLTRIYTNKHGYRIMLSVSYGPDQSDDLAAHDPKGCYPAQGFHIISNLEGTLQTEFGNIPVRYMQAAKGLRHEPVTYWFVIGSHAVSNSWDRKLVQMRYTLKGDIPDGMLFRVSSIDNDNQRAFELQKSFITEILSAIPARHRKKIAGLAS